jgi:hypothetical protein
LINNALIFVVFNVVLVAFKQILDSPAMAPLPIAIELVFALDPEPIHIPVPEITSELYPIVIASKPDVRALLHILIELGNPFDELVPIAIQFP